MASNGPSALVRGIEAALLDAAAVVVAWAAMVFLESLAVALLWDRAFSGSWEVSQARRLVAPIAIAGLAPASVTVVGWWRVARRAGEGARLAKVALAALGAIAGGALALGVSTGRHFASWSLRVPWVAVLAVAGAAGILVVAARLTAFARRPLALASAGGAVCVAAWLADAYVLPRLYPAFHGAMLGVSLVGAALVGLAARAAVSSTRVARAGGLLVGVLLVACVARIPRALRALEPLSNLRIALVEHAPILGLAVEATVAMRPPGVETSDEGTTVAPGAVARALDWTGHDVVLLTVDALRADHVSAYGYPRPTTPAIDALARDGTLFEAAYCPTPHTSYSVTSLMTGKYLRPLLALGLGEDSDTWAEDLRHYGWRTAAFYPPAVFFIDEDRFTRFEHTTLGFEYAKVEFADPALREQQVAGYLDAAPASTPLFLWVHFFEPHEPYVLHADHLFMGAPTTDEDAYDGEVATSDEGIGRIVRLVRARRPGAVVIVTADHGEEFGEHGGRYHGTTVYEEQVRVPMVIAGPGVRAAGRVATVVQTIDLLPTTLSALGIPRPARLRGRDLGPLLAGTGDAKAVDEGFAFAETDDYALVAEGADRLVCQRRAAACALYRPVDDPLERIDREIADPARFERLRGVLRGVERDHGRFEGGAGAPAWPEALRRGMQGDVEAAPDVASLLDDADVVVRRRAAEVCYALRAPSTVPALRRAFARDEDGIVRRWASLALARAGEPPLPFAEGLLRDPERDWRRRAALALGERGEARACDEIAAWWGDVAPRAGQPDHDGEPPRLGMELASAQDLLAATVKARCRSAVPSLVRALADVRARLHVADALGALGDDRARGPLRTLLASEPYVTTRGHEARALLALGARDWPLPGAAPGPGGAGRASLRAPPSTERVLVLLSGPNATLDVSLDGTPLTAQSEASEGEVRAFALGPRSRPGRLDLRASGGAIVAVWLWPTGRLD
jgi:hypothetical protein